MMDDLDRALIDDEAIVPSSGFSSSVMASIQAGTTAPPPLAFPWRRALPGLLAAGIVIVGFVAVLATALSAPTLPESSTWTSGIGPIVTAVTTPAVVWSIAGIGLALISASIGTRMGSVRSFAARRR